jgi:hypothetical protein
LIYLILKKFETVPNPFIPEVMDKTLKVINEMKKDGVIKDYTIGGAIAVMFYTEPFLTRDLDIFFIPAEGERSKLDPLSPIYDYLIRERGFTIWKEYILVEGVTCQFIPVGHQLELEALVNANDVTYGNVQTKALKPEYLIALFVLADRRKDREKIARLFEQYDDIDEDLLTDILRRYNFYDKYMRNRSKYYV